MVQLVKCWFCNQEDLSLFFRMQIKMLNMKEYVYSFIIVEMEVNGFLGVY